MFRPEIATCAEDVSFAKGYGAFTGELSAEMLVDSGIKWTLTGHSERRVGFGFPGETSTVVGIKTKNAIDCGMSVMACIGEQLADREAGNDEFPGHMFQFHHFLIVAVLTAITVLFSQVPL